MQQLLSIHAVSYQLNGSR